MNKETMKTFNKMLGVLCALLPFCIFATKLGDYPISAMFSISVTYHTKAFPIMVTLLGMTGIIFMCYQGYDIIDSMLTSIIGIAAFGIIVFPCASTLYDPERVMLSKWVSMDLSNIFHCTFAGILFLLFGIFIFFRFTKTNTKKMTIKKTRRNAIYRACAIVIWLFMINQAITSIAGIRWFTIINEAVMLWAFSFAWLVKGEAFKCLND